MAQTMCSRCNAHLTNAELRLGAMLCTRCERLWQQSLLTQFGPELEALHRRLHPEESRPPEAAPPPAAQRDPQAA